MAETVKFFHFDQEVLGEYVIKPYLVIFDINWSSPELRHNISSVSKPGITGSLLIIDPLEAEHYEFKS